MQIAASDALIGKIGYGTVSECLAHGKPLVFVRRDYFNEEPFLRRLLQIHNAAVEIRRRDFLEGNWAPFLMSASELKVTFRLGPSLNGSCNILACAVLALYLEYRPMRFAPRSSQPYLKDKHERCFSVIRTADGATSPIWQWDPT